MKVYQMDGKTDSLEFTNYNRIDEEVLFDEVRDKLKMNPTVVIGKVQKGPSEDFYRCTIDGMSFTLWFDIDYGPSIHSENANAIEKLKEYFNN